MIAVFVLLYLLAFYYSKSAHGFVLGSLILAGAWLIFDFVCRYAIRDYYLAQDKEDQIHDDPLYMAVGSWIVCDIVLVIWCTLILLSLRTNHMTETDAAWSMLMIFSYLSYLVLQSVRGGITSMSRGPVSQFIKHHFRHFNAASLMNAAEGYRIHVARGGKVMLTLAGAMSTGELGLSLAAMIREDKVHAITCTGANIEEDLFNLL